MAAESPLIFAMSMPQLDPPTNSTINRGAAPTEFVPVPEGIPGGVLDPQPRGETPLHYWGCVCNFCEATLFKVVYGRGPDTYGKFAH